MTKFKDFDHITGKAPLIFKEIWVFPEITGISPFIFPPQWNQHSAITKYSLTRSIFSIDSYS
jgi:hypothetical protein